MAVKRLVAYQIVSALAVADCVLGCGLTALALDEARRQIAAAGGSVTGESIAYVPEAVDEYGETPAHYRCQVWGVAEGRGGEE